MSTTLIHQGPAYELSVSIEAGPYGHHLKFVSFVPIALRPEEQVRFQAHLSREELAVLREAIGKALRARQASGGDSSAVRPSRSVSEPVGWDASAK